MHYSIYDYGMFFFIYSFLGWLLEEIFAAVKYGKFINRGVLNGPLCPVYGISMLIVTSNLADLAEYPLFQFVTAVVTVTVVEYITGVMMHKIIGKRFWNYSHKKANLNGYICLEYSIFWGACAVGAFWLLHPFFYMTSKLLPSVVGKTFLFLCTVVLLCDVLLIAAVFFQWKRMPAKNVVWQISKAKTRIGQRLFEKMQNRICRSFPELKKQEILGFQEKNKLNPRIFAEGLCFDKLVWIFFISGLLGDWIETAFMWITTGKLMSRSSVLYGTFSIVWGLGGAAATALLYSLRNKNDRYIFIGGFLLGGVYEYSCSLFTEIVLGTTFWDYSKIPFNLNGRVNLLFCFFWGVLALIWIKCLYPAASKPIEKIPFITGKVLTGVIVIFMVLDMFISALAITRYVQRKNGAQENTVIEDFMDCTYPDRLIEQTYPYMKIKK